MNQLFFTIPKELAGRKDLSPSSKLVWAYLNFRQGNNQDCFPSISCICEDTGISRSTAIRSLDALEKQGLIERAERGGGRQNQTRYAVKTVSNRDGSAPETVSKRNCLASETVSKRDGLAPETVSKRNSNSVKMTLPYKEEKIHRKERERESPENEIAKLFMELCKKQTCMNFSRLLDDVRLAIKSYGPDAVRQCVEQHAVNARHGWSYIAKILADPDRPAPDKDDELRAKTLKRLKTHYGGLTR